MEPGGEPAGAKDSSTLMESLAETRSHYVGQAGLELQVSSGPPASVSESAEIQL
ncbi:ZNF696 isoform 6 [Pongo abelii]|uniref:ZNF696 isoform 6 n=1 Tax=Pongo abelii TaxID=9601 RepID=A0A2J8R726_PONAB|nr:ZNF696 isoform 6 [Pongo abelii]